MPFTKLLVAFLPFMLFPHVSSCKHGNRLFQGGGGLIFSQEFKV